MNSDTSKKVFTSILIIINVISIISIYIVQQQQEQPLLTQYVQQIENYKKQAGEIVQMFNDKIDKYNLPLKKVDLELFQNLSQINGGMIEQLKLYTSIGIDLVKNSMIVENQNQIINNIRQMVSQINGQYDTVFIGQVIPILKSVYDDIYGQSDQIDIGGAIYVKMNGKTTLNNFDITTKWLEQYSNKISIPDISDKQIIGNNFVDAYDMNKRPQFYDICFKTNYDGTKKFKDQDIFQKQIAGNEYEIDFNNNAMPSHTHEIQTYSKQKQPDHTENNEQSEKYKEKKYTFSKKNSGFMKIKDFLSKIIQGNNYILDVSDPSVDVYYLLCVSIKN